MLRLITVLMLFSSFNVRLYSQDTVKIMTYNLLNYYGGDIKNQNFRKIMKFTLPDILVVEEIISSAAMNNMLANVMNYESTGLYSEGTFINGFDTDNAVFYKTSKFTFISNIPVHTSLRDINMFTLIHNLSGDTVRLFAVHLKASNSFSDQQQRLSEVNSLRNITNTLSSGTEFIVLGDFNIYAFTEPAYQKLIEVQPNDGNIIDPYNLPGIWNQAAYSPYHSQSTRTRALGDSGATGGMDDRFDMILNSRAVTEEGRIKYIPGSLRPFGNDGNHYNDSINKRPNTSVPDSIADALCYGSDHLPVIALYKFDRPTISVNNAELIFPAEYMLYQNYPNPFNPKTIINYQLSMFKFVSLKVYDILGNEVAALVNEKQDAGSYEIEFNGDNLSSGIYFYRIMISGINLFETINFSDTKRMILLK